MLEYGADPNAVTPQSETPLLLCTGIQSIKQEQNRRTRIAQVLLSYGANPNISTLKGATPLMFAARDNDAHLTRSLLRAGADTDIRTVDGCSAFDIAMKWGSHEVINILRN